MNVWDLVLGFGLWALFTIPLAIGIGRVIRRRDSQIPVDDPARVRNSELDDRHEMARLDDMLEGWHR